MAFFLQISDGSEKTVHANVQQVRWNNPLIVIATL